MDADASGYPKNPVETTKRDRQVLERATSKGVGRTVRSPEDLFIAGGNGSGI